MLIGGDNCPIVSICDTQIVCQTTAPSFDTVNPGKQFLGGTGGKTHFFDMELMESYSFHDVDFINDDLFQDQCHMISKFNINHKSYSYALV